MKMCIDHWEKMKTKVEEKGLSSFVSKGGEELTNKIVKELGNKSTIPDPLFQATMMINGRALEIGGPYLLSLKKDGSHYCPLCELNEHADDEEHTEFETPADDWIDGCIESIRNDFIEKGLLSN